MIQFTVSGEPCAQGRARFTTANGHARAYDPAKSADYKSYVKLVASQHKPAKPLEGALALKVEVYRPIPKSFSKKKRELAEQGKILPTTKPDIDNYVKGIKDACKSILWCDDSQVAVLLAYKWYSDNPRIEVRCYRVGEDDEK